MLSRHIHIKYFLSLAIGFGVSATALAEEPRDSLMHELREVVVVATESKGVASSSRIDRTAMEHLQPTSFTDLLELLPGNMSQDPKMGHANTITLRETGTLSATGAKTDNDNYAISSLGTQFIIDGSPVSTDANMQTVPGADASDAAGRRTTVNRGVDMRTLSTDNIESVEIVRGIPSAEYGNLTSGLVNIRRIKHSTPFTFRFKADEYSKLFSAVKGIDLGRSGHTLNVDLSYLDSRTDPRNNLENYKRITATALPTFRFDSEGAGVVWSVGLAYTASIDNAKTDPDLNRGKVDEYRSDYHRFSLNSDLNISLYECSWLDNVVVNGSASYEDDSLVRRKQVAPSRSSIAPTSMEEGEHFVKLLPGEYIADYRVEGRPVAFDFKAKANGKFSTWSVINRFLAGAEWNMSKNYGRGQVYDLNRPLSGSWTSRPRAFSDIPALHTLSWFAEDNINQPIGGNMLELRVGLRGMCIPLLPKDYYLSGRMYVDPRVNAVWNFPAIEAARPVRFLVGWGWGLTSRMPTLDYLYPQYHYNDIVQLNRYDPENPVDGSIINVRTYKVDVTNRRLRAATNSKWEARLGISWGRNSLSVTYFDERMNNGFRYTPVYNAYSFRKYDASTVDPANASLEGLPFTEASILDGFRTVTNGSRIHKRGIEYTLRTERWMPLRTSLTINGAWLRTEYSNSQALYSTLSDVVGNQPISDMYVGIYDTCDGRVNEQFNTNFLFDTQIPSIGLIFTTNIQCMWYVKTTRLRENGVPTSYISATDGMIHPFDESADPMLHYLVKTYNEDAFATVRIPTAVYVNFKASKRIGNVLRVSAFVNRLIDYLPDYKSNGLTIRRNSDAYFGMEAVITI